MQRKLSLLIPLLIIASFVLAGCQKPPLSEADCVKPEVFCVGLVTSLDGIKDKSYNQSIWEGLQTALTEKSADWVRYIETIDAKDYDQNIATLASAGYDVIVTVGEQSDEATATAAKDYPATYFIHADQLQGEPLPNLAGLVFHEDQSGFLAGALAAQLTKTGTIAGVFGSDADPSMVAFKNGYETGARYIKPGINIISTFYPDRPEMASTDPRWGASTAAKAIQNGADVIFAAGGRTGNGALIEAASHPGLYCIGTGNDQWETIPEARACLISSAMQLITPGMVDLIKFARDGTTPSGNYFGPSGLAPYHDFDNTIPQTVKDNMSQITAGLTGGSITTGYSTNK